MGSKQYRVITQEQADQFVQHGWIKVENCFTREQAANVTSDVWKRLGMSPTDKSTWQEQVHLTRRNRWRIDSFAPKAWETICDLVGDESLVKNKCWGDKFIVNLGSPEGEGKDIPPNQWHVDGQRWVNFLDTGDQGLLIMPLYSDIRPGGGGTMICPDALPKLAKYLFDHPEGVLPGYRPIGVDLKDHTKVLGKLGKSMPPSTWVEVTGKVGDVYFLHPFMLHSRVNNKLREVRIVTNNGSAIKEPFKLYREDPSQHSLIERSTLNALSHENIGREDLKHWRITGKREALGSSDNKRAAKKARKEAEQTRMAQAGADDDYNSSD